MTFNPQTVFGLCNVLNRHATHLDLKISLEHSSQSQIEQWAKRMDLIYRDSAANWHLILKEPLKVVENLKSIEDLASILVSKLYDVEVGIQKQLSKGLGKGGFVKFRSTIREKFLSLKGPMDDVHSLFDEGFNVIVLPEPMAAVDAIIDVWKSSENKSKIPKNLKKNVALKNFMSDCFEVFGINFDPEEIYQKWYKLNLK